MREKREERRERRVESGEREEWRVDLTCHMGRHISI